MGSPFRSQPSPPRSFSHKIAAQVIDDLIEPSLRILSEVDFGDSKDECVLDEIVCVLAVQTVTPDRATNER